MDSLDPSDFRLPPHERKDVNIAFPGVGLSTDDFFKF
jgi:hypothetical protein